MNSGLSAADLSVAAVPHQEPRAGNADSVRVGVIGYGYWGPNIVRNFSALDRCDVISVCDRNANALKRAQKAYPAVHLTTDFGEVLESPDIDAVAISDPVWTHFELAKKRSKTASTSRREAVHFQLAQAIELIELANKRNSRIGRSHVLVQWRRSEDS
jgi:hypothetical protein